MISAWSVTGVLMSVVPPDGCAPFVDPERLVGRRCHQSSGR
jgi:hypothetical protein